MAPPTFRTWLFLATLTLLTLLVQGVHAEEKCLGPVCVREVHEDPAVYVEATNHTGAPITIHLRVGRRMNLQPYPQRPDTQVVAPRSSRKLKQFLPVDPYSGTSFGYRWGWVIGDVSAQHHDSVRYRMPFGGTEARVLSQGVDGEFTHKGAHRFAFDFAMPIGTPIVAARSGQVIRVSDGHTKHGISDEFLTKANAVLVMHDDRTIATYAHLDPGAGVREGMRVQTGDVIGFSGNTGFSTGPHLHFDVWKPLPTGQIRTLPIRFRDETPHGFVPLASALYEPTCHAEGRPCQAGELGEIGQLPASPKELDGACHCPNGSVITTHLPCRMVCPRR